MYVRFLTTNQIKQGLKSKCACCGLSKVICGGLSAALTTYFGPTGKEADTHMCALKRRNKSYACC